MSCCFLQEQNVSILDHHQASELFIKHLQNEQKLRGGCPANWNSIVPAINSGITPLFHQEMINYNIKPSYEAQVSERIFYTVTCLLFYSIRYI